MESRIKIKLGAIEVEYEGSENFLKEELPDLIETVINLYRASELIEEEDESGNKGDNSTDADKGKGIQLTTGSIAAKLGCTSGPDLIIAAAAHLTLVKNTASFTRKQLLKEIKTATGYFKTTYAKNLSGYLQTLTKDKLKETSNGVYALDATLINTIKAKLA